MVAKFLRPGLSRPSSSSAVPVWKWLVPTLEGRHCCEKMVCFFSSSGAAAVTKTSL